MHYVYILRCKDGTLYTGYAKNLMDRLSMHKKGMGAKYTRYRLPVKLVYYEHIGDVSLALKREYKIKKMTKRNKEDLVQKERIAEDPTTYNVGL